MRTIIAWLYFLSVVLVSDELNASYFSQVVKFASLLLLSHVFYEAIHFLALAAIKLSFIQEVYVWQVFDLVAWKVLEVVINDSQLKIVACSAIPLSPSFNKAFEDSNKVVGGDKPSSCHCNTKLKIDDQRAREQGYRVDTTAIFSRFASPKNPCQIRVGMRAIQSFKSLRELNDPHKVGRGFRVREEAEKHATLWSNPKNFQYSRVLLFWVGLRLESIADHRAGEAQYLVPDVWALSQTEKPVRLREVLGAFSMNNVTRMLLSKQYCGAESAGPRKAMEFIHA
ncbi:hypothetical protein NC653_032967 [Populus alba x Populus x berolinensis]|uniref:Uncharacterized protein n=1 Tax=Populus alba x Populus x berolinensis TaxID=444605 RepID=A0AAD6PYK3_9ROSI|nr:hypothetical protein NC653_032967 [Populus alba x Populus x berolinensis]